MQRRQFLKSLIGVGLGTGAVAMPMASLAGGRLGGRHTVIQESCLAGFAHHMGESVWPLLAEGDPLALVREPDNAFDEQAVAVYWNGLQLGYVPRAQNTAVAQMLDRGTELESCVVSKNAMANPDERLRFCICLPV